MPRHQHDISPSQALTRKVSGRLIADEEKETSSAEKRNERGERKRTRTGIFWLVIPVPCIFRFAA